MFIATNVHLTKEITEYGTSDAKLHATITDVQESGNSMFERKEQTMSKCYVCGEPIRRGYPMVTSKGENVIICERCKRLWKKSKTEMMTSKCGK